MVPTKIPHDLHVPVLRLLDLCRLNHSISRSIMWNRRNNVAGIATSYVLDGPEFQTWQVKLLLSAPRPYMPALGPTQSSIQRVTAAALSWPPTPSWRGHRRFYLYLSYVKSINIKLIWQVGVIIAYLHLDFLTSKVKIFCMFKQI
jgi:hypothetical protein